MDSARLLGKLSNLVELFDGECDVERRRVLREMGFDCFDELFVGVGDLTTREVKIGLDRGKSAVVREYRIRSGCSLGDAAEFVQKYFVRNGLVFGSNG